MQNTFSQSGNDSKWFLKKSFFRIGMWHSRPPRAPSPFMANTILNFHFDYLIPSLRRFLFFPILSFFFRHESRSLTMEIIKQTYLAANIKEELRELKRNQQHRANLRTPFHDSLNIVETTPMSSPTSLFGEIELFQEIEGKKRKWCQIPFNCFEKQKNRLKDIRNCKKSKGQ